MTPREEQTQYGDDYFKYWLNMGRVGLRSGEIGLAASVASVGLSLVVAGIAGPTAGTLAFGVGGCTALAATLVGSVTSFVKLKRKRGILLLEPPVAIGKVKIPVPSTNITLPIFGLMMATLGFQAGLVGSIVGVNAVGLEGGIGLPPAHRQAAAPVRTSLAETLKERGLTISFPGRPELAQLVA